MCRCLLPLILLCLMLPQVSRAAEPSPFQFASQEQGRSVLAVRDEFVERLSPFDREARLKSSTEISESQYLAFVAASVLPWEEGPAKARVSSAIQSVTARLAELGLVVRQDILIIRTTGKEEGGAAYTRGGAIVLPDTILGDTRQDLVKLISHETFHVLTRNSKRLRSLTYKVIGFTPCPEFRFPPDLAGRKITNPDAPRNDYCIDVLYRGVAARAVPILYASKPRYDPAKGGEFFEYLVFQLALVSGNAAPQMVGVGDVQGYFEKVGRNTDYIIHPEEILADNFALLVSKASAPPSPAIPAELLKAMQSAK